jgi:hypothetical protein
MRWAGLGLYGGEGVLVTMAIPASNVRFCRFDFPG